MGKTISLKVLRGSADADVPPRLALGVVATIAARQFLLLAALIFLFLSCAHAAPIGGQVSVQTSNGYARLVFTLAEETEAEVRLANGIVIIAFKQQVDISVERIAIGAPNYVGAARRDPDGTGIRLALNRKVTVNSMAAGEKLFVDLLPEDWNGLPPGLPQEVVEELARRAREAEKRARQKLRTTEQRTFPPIRVRVGVQRTFTRYTFALPQPIAVATERTDERVTFTFDAPLKFDLSDAQSMLPPIISSIDAKAGNENVAVNFALIGKVEVRTFREDNNYVVDVVVPGARSDAPPEPKPVASMPAVEPAKPAPVTEKPQAVAPAPARSVEAKSPEPAKTAEPKPAESTPADAKPSEPKAAAPAKAPAAPPIVASEPPATIPARETAEAAKPAAAETKPAPADPSAPVTAEVRRQGESVRLTFPFAAPTPAAVFRRADTIWLVFDTQTPIDINKVAAQSGRIIRSAAVTRSRDGQVVQFKLDRPKLTSVGADGASWSVMVGDIMMEPTQPLAIMRAAQAGGRAAVTIPFEQPSQVHRLSDAEVGDTLLVVTALGPARGFLKPQEFVEFNALASTHGVVVQPTADDITAQLGADKVTIGRPGGLTISTNTTSTPSGKQQGANGAAKRFNLAILDPQNWGFDREANFRDRQSQLLTAASAAEEAQRTTPRLNLARFYLARDMAAEAKGVLDATASDEQAAQDGNIYVLRAIANVMLGRGVDAMKDLTHAAVGERGDAAIWRTLAQAQQGKWSEAREGFRALETATATLPVELQRFAYQEAVRAAVEARDFGTATSLLSQFETLGPSKERDADLAVLKGRTLEGMGRSEEALAAYHAAAESSDRPSAARGKLREIALRLSTGEAKREDAISALESLTIGWRGDETEAEALQVLGRLYAEEGRYRDAFLLMRTALTVYPQSEMTRKIQDEAAQAFDLIFLGGKGDSMAPIDALSLFYDFRDLTPVGRRGDEMIRKLADRLVSVDLLDQAAELLQHQVDNRLQGAARAQVAVRLAVIYLMGRKPDRAIQVLRASRSGDLPGELRSQRLMLEARAHSDVGRPELALEVIANLSGREADRLRADVLWKARRWRDAGEEIEKFYGERWREFAPLNDAERADILRAGIGFALADDSIGLDRLRAKYSPKMSEGPDRRSFDVVTSPSNAQAPEFADIAKTVAAADTLDVFLRDIRAKFPETIGPGAGAPRSAPATRAGAAG